MQHFSEIRQVSNIKMLLTSAQKIAVVGLSPKENRPSNMVGRYLIDVGYDVYPINPGQIEILGQTCYPSISVLPNPVDIVDIFRKSEDVLSIVEEIVAQKVLPNAIWMQLGIINNDAAKLACEYGIQVIMDRCIKVDHESLCR